MASRADVIVRFGGDKRGVDTTLGQIRQSVSGLGSMLAGLGAGFSAGALAATFREAMAWGDDLANTSRRVGLTTDAVQALRNSAEFLGSTTTQVDDALTKFNVNLGKAVDGTGELKDVAEKYGIQLRDQNGKVRDTNAIFVDYIALLQRTQNTADRARIASAGLGRGAIELGQAIGEANVPLADLIRQQKELGTIVATEDVQRLSELQTQWTQLMQQISAGTKGVLVGASREVNTLLSGFERVGIMLSHWASGDFIGPQGVVDLLKVKPPEKPVAPTTAGASGAPTEEGEKKIDDAMKAREAAKDAARLKDMTAAQRQWELESRILRAMNAEKDAMAKKDEESARKAQELQEESLRKLIADPITPDYIVEKYRKMVTAIEAAPGPNVKLKIEWEGLAELPKKLQDVIMAPGSQYVVPVDMPVRPYIVGWVTPNDPNMGVGKEAQSGPYTNSPLTDLIKEANDAVGANP